jgi:hypothetical protein
MIDPAYRRLGLFALAGLALWSMVMFLLITIAEVIAAPW